MYIPDKNIPELFLKMDECWNDNITYTQLREKLFCSSWRLQQAALFAIGDRGLKAAVPDIVEVLNQQDALDIYGAGGKDEWSLDDARDDVERETWRCRFRVKQAACIALGRLAEKYGEESIGKEAVEKLKQYAVSQDDDYAVRAVACQALGKTRDKSAVECLEKATHDGEWCTKTHAAVALAEINAKRGEGGRRRTEDRGGEGEIGNSGKREGGRGNLGYSLLDIGYSKGAKGPKF